MLLYCISDFVHLLWNPITLCFLYYCCSHNVLVAHLSLCTQCNKLQFNIYTLTTFPLVQVFVEATLDLQQEQSWDQLRCLYRGPSRVCARSVCGSWRTWLNVMPCSLITDWGVSLWPTKDAPMTPHLSVTDQLNCAWSALSSNSTQASFCVYRRREVLVKHLTLLSKNQGLCLVT